MLTLFIQQTKSGLKVGACLVTITITYMFFRSMILELGSEDLIMIYSEMLHNSSFSRYVVM